MIFMHQADYHDYFLNVDKLSWKKYWRILEKTNKQANKNFSNFSFSRKYKLCIIVCQHSIVFPYFTTEAVQALITFYVLDPFLDVASNLSMQISQQSMSNRSMKKNIICWWWKSLQKWHLAYQQNYQQWLLI